MNIDFVTNMDPIKGRNNRFKVGQKVKAKLALAKDHVEHLVSYYNVNNEIREKDLEEISNWIRSYLSKNPPVGVVAFYGDQEREDNHAFTNRKFVWVEFKFRGGFKVGTFVSEKDLTAVKTKSRKK
jgi:hypothetical protein